jgi:hypothetical protein
MQIGHSVSAERRLTCLSVQRWFVEVTEVEALEGVTTRDVAGGVAIRLGSMVSLD